MSVQINGTNGLTFADSSTQNTAATGFGFKNRLINGDMRTDQRNAGASVSNANGYTLDRFYLMRGNASSNPVFNVQQSTTVPSGFKNSLGITVGTSGAPGTTNYSCLYQRIEGTNCADLDFGLATAKTVTLSFWVNCSVTGTFGIAFQNDATNRSYIASYTVNSANTWEYKTVTITGDTSGTWLTTNGTGIGIYWDVGIGTTQSTTAGSWQAGNYLGLTGGTKLSNTSGATFYITGVQLEKGSTATSFDYRPYGTELALCQRYCYRLCGTYAYEIVGNGAWNGNTTFVCTIPHKVSMRTQASLTTSGSFTAAGNVSAYAVSGFSLDSNASSVAYSYLQCTTSSSTSGYGGALVASNDASAKLVLSAEL